MEPATGPSTGGGALRRYLPLVIVAVIVVAAIAIFAVVRDGDDDAVVEPPGGEGLDLPIIYAEALEAGTVDDHDWVEDCDPDVGRLAIPTINTPPCVPAFSGDDNGGATHRGVTADTIRVAYYVSPTDPQQQALLTAAGAYDPPETAVATVTAYTELFQAVTETYGRTVELVELEGTGVADDETAARADAIRAAEELDVFAVINGPNQTRAFAEELSARGVLCLGSCLLAQPESFYEEHYPHIFGTGPSPEQTADHTLELIEKQLVGRPAEFAGDPALRDQERVFAYLTYDTPDGNFAAGREKFKEDLADIGVDLAAHVNYFLDLSVAQEDARTIVTRLRDSGATTVIFSGDPLMPTYFTEEATDQGYFPEWLISGTVLADTTTLARPYDPEQWGNAFGISLPTVRGPQEQGAYYRLHEWWFGEPPEQENGYALTGSYVNLLFAGIQLAGPELTPETFGAAVRRIPPVDAGPNALRQIVTYGDHGIWDREDFNGLDNATLIWWDPEATGEDETGREGEGMYRFVDGGRRYLPGEWPTEPLPLFDRDRSVTVYDELPEDLQPPREYPPHPASPRAG